MNKEEAYKILGLEYGASKEEVKKKFKELSKEKHPDKNPKYAEEFKKISSAYTFLKNPPPEPSMNPFEGFNPFSGFGFDFSNFTNPFKSRANRQHYVENICVDTKISFKESVTGCKKKISFDRQQFCQICRGNGLVASDENCSKCNGSGVTINDSVIGTRRVSMRTPCIQCNGTGKNNTDCSECSGDGFKIVNSTIDVRIPGGVIDQQIMRLHRMGNLGSDAYLKICVKKDKNMIIKGQDVISNVRISLLDAIKGSQKDVKTVFGNKKININPKTKHKDEIRLRGLGVENRGDHIFIIDIEYPKNIDDLVDILEKGEV